MSSGQKEFEFGEDGNEEKSLEKTKKEINLSAKEVLETSRELSGYDGYENYVEVERYWVIRPYSYIALLYEPTDQNYIYYIVEPELDEYEELFKQNVSDRLRDRLRTKNIDDTNGPDVHSLLTRREDILLEEAISVANDYGVGFGSDSLHKVLYFIERDFLRYGKIEPIMQDPRIEDISCDGKNVPVYVFHRQIQDIETNISFERDELNNFVSILSQRAGKHISAADPLVDASLPDGSRAQLTLGEDVTTRGSTFTIRKFRDEPLTPVHLIKFGTFSLEQMSYLWMAIENDMSLIFAGGTGSGKTTSMNSVSLFIPPKKKVVSIEDTREVTLPHENWVPSVTRGAFGATGSGEGVGDDPGEVTMFSLLRTALRQRPEYLIVGEVRGPEAKTLFQAMATGHTTYSTFHAENVESVFQRFRNDPINVSEQMLRALDVVSVQDELRINNERQRRNRIIAEVKGISEDGEGINYGPYFTYDAESDEHREAPGNSTVLQKIAEDNGWSMHKTHEERRKRERVLRYLVENDIEDYKDVTRIIHAFIIDQDRILEAIETDSLDPKRFEDMESIKVI